MSSKYSAVKERPIQKTFNPQGAVTGIGSLPFTDVEQALDFIAEFSPEAPFWPELVQHPDENGMLEIPLTIEDHFLEKRAQFGFNLKDISPHNFMERLYRRSCIMMNDSPAFRAFEYALNHGKFPEARAVKGQMVGPITLAACLFYENKPLLENPIWVEKLSRVLLNQIRIKTQSLRANKLPLLFFLDEPCLFMLKNISPDAARSALGVLNSLIAKLRSDELIPGIHTCAEDSLAYILDITPDILSCDVSTPETSLTLSGLIKNLLTGESMIAFGMVPTLGDLSEFQPEAARIRWEELADNLVDKKTLAERSFVTASCGLAFATPDNVQKSFQKAGELSRLIKAEL